MISFTMRIITSIGEASMLPSAIAVGEKKIWRLAVKLPIMSRV